MQKFESEIVVWERHARLAVVGPEAVQQCGVTESTSKSPATTSSATTNPVVPLDVEIWDGKSLRGTRRSDQRAEQVVVRMQRALGVILVSNAVPANTNETTVALGL